MKTQYRRLSRGLAPGDLPPSAASPSHVLLPFDLNDLDRSSRPPTRVRVGVVKVSDYGPAFVSEPPGLPRQGPTETV